MADAVESAPKKVIKKKKSEITAINKPGDSGFGSAENVSPGDSAVRRRSSGKETTASSPAADAPTSTATAAADANASAGESVSSRPSSRRGSSQPAASSAPERALSLTDVTPVIAEESSPADAASPDAASHVPGDSSAQSKVNVDSQSNNVKNNSIPEEVPMNVNPDEDKVSREELINYRLACDSLLKDLQDRLSHEEDAASNLQSNKKKLEGDLSNLKKDMENLELALQKVK